MPALTRAAHGHMYPVPRHAELPHGHATRRLAAVSATSLAPPRRSFTDLPAELRVKVYQELFANVELDVRCLDNNDNPSGATNIVYRKADNAVLKTSRKVRAEALPIFHTQTTILVTTCLSAFCVDIFDGIPEMVLQSVQFIVFKRCCIMPRRYLNSVDFPSLKSITFDNEWFGINADKYTLEKLQEDNVLIAVVVQNLHIHDREASVFGVNVGLEVDVAIKVHMMGYGSDFRARRWQLVSP